jgi:hypothetical protein
MCSIERERESLEELTWMWSRVKRGRRFSVWFQWLTIFHCFHVQGEISKWGEGEESWNRLSRKKYTLFLYLSIKIDESYEKR